MIDNFLSIFRGVHYKDYLDYQNRRAGHLTALWRIVDWNVAGKITPRACAAAPLCPACVP
ncbi:MAG: hypothetical protein II525_09210 [Bacteroidales bacterium]|nr:hypothetical protein [Bacteroidales bacterium]